MIYDDWYKSMTKKKTQYMSDSTLYAILQEKKMGLPSTYQLREAVLESMEEVSCSALHGPRMRWCWKMLTPLQSEFLKRAGR